MTALNGRRTTDADAILSVTPELDGDTTCCGGSLGMFRLFDAGHMLRNDRRIWCHGFTVAAKVVPNDRAGDPNPFAPRILSDFKCRCLMPRRSRFVDRQGAADHLPQPTRRAGFHASRRTVTSFESTFQPVIPRGFAQPCRTTCCSTTTGNCSIFAESGLRGGKSARGRLRSPKMRSRIRMSVAHRGRLLTAACARSWTTISRMTGALAAFLSAFRQADPLNVHPG